MTYNIDLDGQALQQLVQQIDQIQEQVEQQTDGADTTTGTASGSRSTGIDKFDTTYANTTIRSFSTASTSINFSNCSFEYDNKTILFLNISSYCA
jgi:hypothetical protein